MNTENTHRTTSEHSFTTETSGVGSAEISHVWGVGWRAGWNWRARGLEGWRAGGDGLCGGVRWAVVVKASCQALNNS